jgi:desulfoferrodoxin (superoxide reductase-like protein)
MKDLKMRNINIFVLMMLSVATFLVSCTVSDNSGGDSGGKTGGVVFYSPASPGIWEQQAAEHDPEITITRTNENKTINVNIPFAQQTDARHYIEVIVVLDLNRNELKKVSFDKKRKNKGAKFDFPESFNTPVYVVMKCNKHGMWEKLVDWSE